MRGFVDGEPVATRSERLSLTIDGSRSVAVIPLASAQSTVDRFFRGMEQEYREIIRAAFSNLGDQLQQITLGILRSSATEAGSSAHQQAVQMVETVFPSVSENAWDVVARLGGQYTQSYLQTVSVMPKAELASLAETLVAMAAMESKLRPLGRVGGTINVAVVSRDEGFRWVRRSRYSPQDLNVVAIDEGS